MNFEDLFDDDYLKAISAEYWSEEDEFKQCIHPTQVKERIEQVLNQNNVTYNTISYMRWLSNNKEVEIHLDGNSIPYGIFNYYTNEFVA